MPRKKKNLDAAVQEDMAIIPQNADSNTATKKKNSTKKTSKKASTLETSQVASPIEEAKSFMPNPVNEPAIKENVKKKPNVKNTKNKQTENSTDKASAQISTVNVEQVAKNERPEIKLSEPSVKFNNDSNANESNNVEKQESKENNERRFNNNKNWDRRNKPWQKNNRWNNKPYVKKQETLNNEALEEKEEIFKSEVKLSEKDNFEDIMLNEPLSDNSLKNEFENKQKNKNNWNNKFNKHGNQNKPFIKQNQQQNNDSVGEAEKKDVKEITPKIESLEDIKINTPLDFVPIEEVIDAEYEVLEEYFAEQKAPKIETKEKIEPFIYENTQLNDLALSKFYKESLEFLKEKLLLREGDTVICAVSGGVDSIAMFDIIATVCAQNGYRTSIAHFNHNLRGKESQDDERFLQRWTSQLGIKFYHSSMNVKEYAEKNSMSIEEAARYLRYKFFEKTARSANSNVILTAHTKDDSVETFFLNLFRGSGLTGLSGIPEIRGIKKSKLIIARPLLNFRKSELIEYSQKRALQWREDSSNKLKEFTRNKVRLSLLPYLEKEFTPAIYDVINRAEGIIARADKFISFYVRQKAPNIITEKSAQKICFNIALLTTLDEFIQCEILQYAIQDNLLSNPLPIDAIERILNLASKETGAICDINKYLFALKDREEIIIARKRQLNQISETIDKIGKIDLEDRTIYLKEIDKKDVKIDSNPLVEYFDSELIPKRIKLRNWANGDKFQPLGMNVETSLSDFLTNQKISVYDRQSVLTLATSEDIIWVCGVRISEKFKVSESTKKVLRAEIVLKPIK